MKLPIQSIILLLLMLLSASLAAALRPTISLADERVPIELEAMVPKTFGDWRELTQSNVQLVNPQQTEELAKLYSQTISRTYVNTNGATIMLSIAYGKNQSHDLQVHRPEVCYSAQGFQILSSEKSQLKSATADIPVMQLVAKKGQRNEPLTYWVRIGGKIVRGNLEQGVARLNYGVQGLMPDGILFRVSSIDVSNIAAFELQRSFIADLLSALPETAKSYLLGDQQS